MFLFPFKTPDFQGIREGHPWFYLIYYFQISILSCSSGISSQRQIHLLEIFQFCFSSYSSFWYIVPIFPIHSHSRGTYLSFDIQLNNECLFQSHSNMFLQTDRYLQLSILFSGSSLYSDVCCCKHKLFPSLLFYLP